MKKEYIVIAVAAILCSYILGKAYTYKYQQQETISVTGLGESEFESDLIVWNGYITAESTNMSSGYAVLENNKQLVEAYLKQNSIPQDEVVFQFVNVEKLFESVYNADGNWVGQRFTGYRLRQQFTIESKDVDAVEAVSRGISSLIAKGVQIEAQHPQYYYTKLDEVKLDLIEQASEDARNRARKIAKNAGSSREGRLISSRMGVFQITGANSNEEFSAGGAFNTSSRSKKARITIRAEYRVK